VGKGEFMTIEDFRNIFAGIRDGKFITIPYQLHRDNQINMIIETFGGASEAFDYFMKVSEAEPADFYEDEEDYRTRNIP